MKGIQLSRKDYRIAELLIQYHCWDDQQGIEAIQTAPWLTRKDKERVRRLYMICKDMDGLDRVRFNGLDYRMLRTEYARRLPLVAGCLLQEPIQELFNLDTNPQPQQPRVGITPWCFFHAIELTISLPFFPYYEKGRELISLAIPSKLSFAA